jgi:crotonobetainyl-CoA:carnitine CoA-transferase CaiB-like acyl-CoA transferase
MLGEAVLDHTVNGRTPRRIGNRHRAWAPHGCYPCRGPDRWIAIAVRHDADWTACCRVLGEPDWTHDWRFDNSLKRWKHADLLDQFMAATTQPLEATALAMRLRAVGVPAGVVQTNQDLLGDAHLRTRQAFWMIAHHLAGTYPYPAPSTRLTETPPGLRCPAPNLGEPNTDVLTRLLGLSPAEIQGLEAKGVIGTVVR